MILKWIQRMWSPADEFHPAKSVFGDGPLITLKNVTKAFTVEAGTFFALRDVNLSINCGEFVAVVGKSGSGKSTLVNMITGIDHPSGGEVLIGGISVHRLSENQTAMWRGLNVGVVFQFYQLLPTLSVLDNIILPMDFCNRYRPEERSERAMALLDLVGLADQAKKLPASLSGGQQQRAAIARAIANDPLIIVADEPTGNLDSNTAETIFDLFINLVKRGTTILMVTHDKELTRRVDRTILVSDGRIA